MTTSGFRFIRLHHHFFMRKYQRFTMLIFEEFHRSRKSEHNLYEKFLHSEQVFTFS